jgi:hypothetical protein
METAMEQFFRSILPRGHPTLAAILGASHFGELKDIKAEIAALNSQELADLRLSLLRLRRNQAPKAPHCFGSPTLRDANSDSCHRCRFAEECLEAGRVYAKLLVDVFDIAVPKEPRGIFLREYYVAKQRKANGKYWITEQDRRKARRADDYLRIDKEHQRRLKALLRATASRRTGKRLEQLRGREVDVAFAWKARAYAVIRRAEGTSDADVASVFVSMRPGQSYSRHQARSDRKLIQKLESDARVWAPFVAEKTA